MKAIIVYLQKTPSWRLTLVCNKHVVIIHADAMMFLNIQVDSFGFILITHVQLESPS